MTLRKKKGREKIEKGRPGFKYTQIIMFEFHSYVTLRPIYTIEHPNPKRKLGNHNSNKNQTLKSNVTNYQCFNKI